MNLFKFILLVLTFWGCTNKASNSELRHSEWNQMLEDAFLFTGIFEKTNYLYSSYTNAEVLDSLQAFYYYGSKVVGYEYKESIEGSIKELKNRPIKTRIDTFSNLNIKFQSDTNNIDRSYAMLSSPIFFDDKIMMALGWKENKSNERKWWILYFNRNVREVELMSIYDFQKDDFYFKGEVK